MITCLAHFTIWTTPVKAGCFFCQIRIDQPSPVYLNILCNVVVMTMKTCIYCTTPYISECLSCIFHVLNNSGQSFVFCFFSKSNSPILAILLQYSLQRCDTFTHKHKQKHTCASNNLKNKTTNHVASKYASYDLNNSGQSVVFI